MADHQPESDHPQFKEAPHPQATVKELFKLVTEPNTRVSSAAVQLSAEYLRLFATEAIHRSAEVAQQDRTAAASGPAVLETKHLEKVLAGLLLDFS
ncbi:CENP-S associating centromere protein X-domain-containing protein [Rhodotorula diobovata]|uniref:CENP-S associating centromere protein X-domain-containing protein n=1 Tax=Rhodotorula diobovata TaxID=5288 RepID=A0A5C5G8U3_9BASI|nr:CENP-S associating centromere protein X-domain-containing protein [Rhodotorula diobovata]